MRSSPTTTPLRVSIVVLTHNALRYCRLLFASLEGTRDVDYEVVVVDNGSRFPTRRYLQWLYRRKRINRLLLIDRNTLFAEGNNIGVAASSRDCSHVLLLNSDVEIRDPLWLRKLLDLHVPGASALGYVEAGPLPRADGYCFLIDRALYLHHQLDENHQWWWAITKLQALIMRDGYRVRAVDEHDHLIHHFGGKSGKGFRRASGMEADEQAVLSWFDGRRVELLQTVA